MRPCCLQWRWSGSVWSRPRPAPVGLRKRLAFPHKLAPKPGQAVGAVRTRVDRPRSGGARGGCWRGRAAPIVVWMAGQADWARPASSEQAAFLNSGAQRVGADISVDRSGSLTLEAWLRPGDRGELALPVAANRR